jgi:hypothetical protein
VIGETVGPKSVLIMVNDAARRVANDPAISLPLVLPVYLFDQTELDIYAKPLKLLVGEEGLEPSKS